jgi:hypothetical protein
VTTLGRRLASGGARCAAVAVVLMSLVAVATPGASGAGHKRASRGKLTIRISGLPRHEQGNVLVTGPRQSRREHGRFHVVIDRLGKVRLRGLRPGKYKLKVRPARIERRHGAVKRGATAFPARRQLRVKVGRHLSAHASVRYRTIRNPGVRSLKEGRILRVMGGRKSPRALLVRGGRDYRRGMVLTARPSRKLPRGLMARVKRAKHGRFRSLLFLRPAGIYEVAPNFHFHTRLRASAAATASAGVTCEGGSGITPFIRVSNVVADGGWTTSRVWPFGDIETGARINLAFDVGAGVDVAAAVGGSCQLSLPGFTLQGFAAGIPIYGSVSPVLIGSAAFGARLKAEGKVRVSATASVSAVPPSASPSISVSSPTFTFSNEVFSDVGLGFGLRTEVGIGLADAANIHAAFGNSLDFNVGGGVCRWDLRLGTFSAGGELGHFGISTPSTPPLYAQNLWQTPCLPPPLTAPLLRAQAAWNTDADVDLYTWDDAGNEAYFGDREAVPGAELIEDVIPGEAEVVHDPEMFNENNPLGRHLTFGLCLFRGEATDVTLTVPFMPDPRGPVSTFQVPLHYEGEGVVVANSPVGQAFTPPPDWCRSVAD